jgi:hypothetical protein
MTISPKTFTIGPTVYTLAPLTWGDVQALEALIDQAPLRDAERIRARVPRSQYEAAVEGAVRVMQQSEPASIASPRARAFLLSVRGAPELVAMSIANAKGPDGKRLHPLVYADTLRAEMDKLPPAQAAEALIALLRAAQDVLEVSGLLGGPEDDSPLAASGPQRPASTGSSP